MMERTNDLQRNEGDRAAHNQTNDSNAVTDQVSSLANEAQQRAKSVVNEKQKEAASQLSNVANALHETGRQLEQNDQSGIASYSHQIANQVENVAHYLEAKDIEGLVRDAKGFAQKQPELFLATSFAAGILLARFIKSSNRPTEPSMYTRDDRYPSTTPRQSPIPARATTTNRYGS